MATDNVNSNASSTTTSTSPNPRPTVATAVHCNARENECDDCDCCWDHLAVSSNSNSLPFGSGNSIVNNANTSTPIRLAVQCALLRTQQLSALPTQPLSVESCNGAGKIHQPQSSCPLPSVFERFGAHAKYYGLHSNRINANSNGYYANANQLEHLIGGIVDVRLVALLILLAVIIIPYKMVIITSEFPYAKVESLFDISNFTQTKFLEALDWANENELSTKLSALLCGLAVAIFGCMMVYMDSSIPGVNPRLPFSTRKHIYLHQKSTALHLNYMMALAVGAVISIFMYLDLYD